MRFRIEASSPTGFVILSATLGFASPSAAQGPVADTPAAVAIIAPAFLSIDEYLDSGGIKLANGKTADPDDWRAIAIWRTTGKACTAALIGRQVVLTSAHCLDASPGAPLPVLAEGATARFDGRNYPLTECKMHPDYEAAGSNGNYPRSGRDYALCKTKYPVQNVAFENVTQNMLQGGRVVLMGFGCYELNIVNGKLKPKWDPDEKPQLRLGDQTIESAAQALQNSGATLSRTVSRNSSQPNLCPGDSGGPVLTGITGNAPKKGRRISGLNSAFYGDWGINVANPIFYSYLAPTGSSFFGWAREWADKRGLFICGIQRNPGLDGCRD